MIAPATTFNTLVLKYYQLGWAALSFVYIFNIGFLIWYIYDLYNMCKYSNKEMM
jgi:hypothetical protein